MGGIETHPAPRRQQRRPVWRRSLVAAALGAGLLAACGTGDDPEVLGVVEERPETPAVAGTYDAAGQQVQVTVRLIGPDGAEVDAVEGTGDLTFSFEGLDPGTYEVEADEQGEAVEAGDETTSSAFVARTDPFDVGPDDTVEVTCRWRDGCDL
jgi:hypothetical protein